MKLSVIIPTYNRSKTLDKCLERLLDQTCPQELYEIVLVDDGSETSVKEYIKEQRNIRVFEQTHGGPAKARNKGVENARGEIILFMGDDIIADKALIEEHIKWHDHFSEGNIAVLGHVSWPPEKTGSSFLAWLDQGAQFGYGNIQNIEDVSYDYFYTSNISLKRSFLLNSGMFDEDFKYAAFEDTELGYRLKDKGLKMIYRKEAIAYHDHILSKKDFSERTRKAGKALKVFMEKQPELKEKYVTDINNIFIKRVFASIVWSLPNPVAACIPKKILFSGYDHRLYFYLKEGYNSDK